MRETGSGISLCGWMSSIEASSGVASEQVHDRNTNTNYVIQRSIGESIGVGVKFELAPKVAPPCRSFIRWRSRSRFA